MGDRTKIFLCTSCDISKRIYSPRIEFFKKCTIEKTFLFLLHGTEGTEFFISEKLRGRLTRAKYNSFLHIIIILYLKFKDKN